MTVCFQSVCSGIACFRMSKSPLLSPKNKLKTGKVEYQNYSTNYWTSEKSKHLCALNISVTPTVIHILCPAELSSTLMEKMQAQEMMSGLRIPEMDELSHFFRSLPTSTLVGIGALTAVLAYWLATRPRPIKPPCSLQHQSEEVPVRWSAYSHIKRLITLP